MGNSRKSRSNLDQKETCGFLGPGWGVGVIHCKQHTRNLGSDGKVLYVAYDIDHTGVSITKAQ